MDRTIAIGRCTRLVIVSATVIALTQAGPALAEKNVYLYDALGRLTHSCQSSPNLGAATTYDIDAAGNRKNVRTNNNVVTLEAGGQITSPGGQYFLAMQMDGNLVLYGASGAVWATGTYFPGSYMAFQNDGNLVIYKSDRSTPVWDSQTQSDCASLAVQDDGNLVIYSVAGPPIWASRDGHLSVP